MNKERFQAKLSLQKKIKNQDEEKKDKNIEGEAEAERWRDERFFLLS